MRELTRSNDPVFLSCLRASLAEAGVVAMPFDGYSSGLLQPLNATAGERIMVEDADYWTAWAVLAEIEGRVSEDTVLGGRVTLLQPMEGFRAAVDPILLAAAVPVDAGDAVLELGAGTGAASLALAMREPACRVDGIELQPDLAALAQQSARLNSLEARTQFVAGDILNMPAVLAIRRYEHVMANPPFLPAAAAQASKDPARALATIEGDAGLVDWVRIGLDHLKERGTITLVHRADRIDEIVRCLGGRVGAVAVLEFLTKADGRPAKRAIVQATKGATPTEIKRRTMLLHDDDGAFTADAQAILRDARPIAISD